MNLFLPAIAAILQAASFTLDKATLSLKRVSFRTYLGISFPLIFLLELIIFFFFRPPFQLELFSDKILLFIIFLVLLSLGNNIFYYRALDYDRLSELEILNLLTFIPTLLWAHIIFADERKPFLLFLALLASLAIIWSHWEKHHFRLMKRTLPFLLWTITLAPFTDIISKEIIKTLNPLVMLIAKDGIVALILGSTFFSSVERVSKKAFWYLVLTNLLTTAAWLLYYFSIEASGIIYTILIFSLTPLLVYFAALFFLGEPFRWKKFTAFLVVLVSIVVAQTMRLE